MFFTRANAYQWKVPQVNVLLQALYQIGINLQHAAATFQHQGADDVVCVAVDPHVDEMVSPLEALQQNIVSNGSHQYVLELSPALHRTVCHKIPTASHLAREQSPLPHVKHESSIHDEAPSRGREFVWRQLLCKCQKPEESIVHRSWQENHDTLLHDVGKVRTILEQVTEEKTCSKKWTV